MATPPPPAMADTRVSSQVRDEIDELQSDLRESRQKLKSVEAEKSDLADRLTNALKQLDQSKVNVTELRGRLQQAQDALHNSTVDNAQSPPSRSNIRSASSTRGRAEGC